MYIYIYIYIYIYLYTLFLQKAGKAATCALNVIVIKLVGFLTFCILSFEVFGFLAWVKINSGKALLLLCIA
ncbi:hypothetical protein GGTG_12835 [Gaeumannomyces tritici R3-111a-1]|uniref:Uncharacterized protein n=1 Tax=Gaeumannomyces tritici (strain R3-111a-1) TaxID=644352 RepID=J3PH55_GAET3|nr:hypothetical protein GGTG_12835 [Gaeumannomyces tritici R3-111a-1]EJT69215.1 hypothetical protein GGTG_12835 [Gaeumannomyces tritici R3-111a-1]